MFPRSASSSRPAPRAHCCWPGRAGQSRRRMAAARSGLPLQSAFRAPARRPAGFAASDAASNFQPTAGAVAGVAWTDKTGACWSPRRPTRPGPLLDPATWRNWPPPSPARRQPAGRRDLSRPDLRRRRESALALAMTFRHQQLLQVLRHDRLAPGLAGGAERHVREIEKLAQNLYIAPSTVAQHAALAAFRPETTAILEARRREFQGAGTCCCRACASLASRSRRAAGRLLCLCRQQRLAADSGRLAERLLNDAGVAATPGLDFGSNAPRPHALCLHDRPGQDRRRMAG
jgi:hypothetical protein